MNHQPECFDFWHGASLGSGGSSMFKLSPWGHKWPHPRGHRAKTVENLLIMNH